MKKALVAVVVVLALSVIALAAAGGMLGTQQGHPQAGMLQVQMQE